MIPKIVMFLHDYKKIKFMNRIIQNNTAKDRLAFSSSQSKTARMFSYVKKKEPWNINMPAYG